MPGGSEPLIPYIISPRYTLLLNEQPTLRWNSVEGASSYVVSLYKADGSFIWNTKVSGTEVDYQGKSPLEREVDYCLVIKADNGRSSKDESVNLENYDPQERGVSGLNFRLIGEDEVSKVQSLTEEIAKLDYTEEDKAIALAHEYAENDLFAEAIDTLEGLVKGDTTKPEVYRSLGAFYGASGLNLLAERRYLRAIELAASTQERWEQATTQAQLGELYIVMKKNDEAVRRLREAQVEYHALGVTELANQLKERIEEILKPPY